MFWLYFSSPCMPRVQFNKKCHVIQYFFMQVIYRIIFFTLLSLSFGKVLIFCALFLGDTPNKKILKLLSDLLEKLPIIYIGGIKVFLFEILQTKYPKGFSACFSALEVSKDYILIQKNYLIHLNKLYLRLVFFYFTSIIL